MTQFNLLNQDGTDIPDDWFLPWSSQADRQASPCGPIWKSAIEHLKNNRETLRNITFEKVARLMTQPLTDAHLSELAPATANNAAKRQPLEDLWRFFIAALIEWPSNYTSKLAGVLEHIQKRQGGPYQGQLMVEGELLLWQDLPYFEHAWRRECQIPLELIISVCLNKKTLERARIRYIKEQETAAIITSCKIFEEGLFTYQEAFRHMVETLERTPLSLVPWISSFDFVVLSHGYGIVVRIYTL
ncbi:hypothetical protein PFICI_14521 [Pestalotiopsis fici W106-1]|uniref:Uncharacterized protein n=1 Tax=Pestalotiopsis fici (strain W106-1 / CGMCC3.15140) TaxID=1229662 RepID=W3WI13_PESFW|nr:uncharacterized protein PFICI_14521 [Pestalotiopsis fici W106-1]ETS73575.1 hypothetical protein PFICI_14521 [Pestalotiopsis fici W106-1]